MKISAKSYSILLLLLFAICLFSCSIESYATRKASSNQRISNYLIDNNIDVVPQASGLVIIPLNEGDGECPKHGDRVAFHYNAYSLDGELFDSSYDKQRPLIVELGNNMIIKGLEEALMQMKKKSKCKVIIPFYLAYNDMQDAPVPPFSDLIFEIELIDFTPNK